jgi:hypothetical protein
MMLASLNHPRALCACAPRATQAAQGSWYALRTPRFEAWTDGDVEVARALLLDLERFHQVLRRAEPGADGSTPSELCGPFVDEMGACVFARASARRLHGSSG